MKTAIETSTVRHGTGITAKTLLHKPATTELSGWKADAALRFNERMVDSEQPFPYIFGVDAVKRQTLRYAFVAAGGSEVRQLSEALKEFVAEAPRLGKRTSLVVFFEQRLEASAGLEEYERWFWHLLQDLHRVDEQPWPAEIPTDTEHSEWEFSFAGMPMFVVANTPLHTRRQSRYFENFAITFQPRFVFDDIAGDSPQGMNARKIIRKRLRDYDSINPPSTLGDFGAEGNREWVQYFLPDDETVPSDSAVCPFTHRSIKEF